MTVTKPGKIYNKGVIKISDISLKSRRRKPTFSDYLSTRRAQYRKIDLVYSLGMWAILIVGLSVGMGLYVIPFMIAYGILTLVLMNNDFKNNK